MAKYPNLPGTSVNLADGGLVINQAGNGPRLMIVAPSLVATAPDEPTLIRQETELAQFGYGGLYVNGEVNPIAAEFRLAQQSGVSNIYVLALKGATDKEKFINLHSHFFGTLVDFEVDHVVLSGPSIEDQAMVAATDFEDPEDKLAFPSLPGIAKYGEVLKGSLAVQLPLTIATTTNDKITIVDKSTGAVDKVITLSPKTYDGTEGKTIATLAADLTTQLATAVPGLKAVAMEGRILIVGKTKFALKETTALATALQLTPGDAVKEESTVGEIVVGQFAKLLAAYAEAQSLGNNATIAYIGTPEMQTGVSLANVREHAKKIMELNTKYSGFLQIVGQEVTMILPGGTSHYLNGATLYAALVMSLAPQSAPTSKQLFGSVGLRYQYGASQRNALTGHRVVTFYVKNGQVLVTDGITSAPQIFIGNKWVDSDYTRLSTVRITNFIAQEIRDVCETFIGEPNEMPQYNAMNASIKGALERAVSTRVIRDAKFSIIPGRDLGSAIVKLRVLPQFETRSIDINIALSTPDTF